jgi:hypothetical protein
MMKKLVKNSLFLLLSLQSITAYASGFSFFADYLNWHASEETGSSWASDITSPRVGAVTFTPENINFNVGPGVRAGVSYEPTSAFWDTRLYWTHYGTKASSDVSRSAQILVPEFFSGFLSDNFFFSGSVNWKIVMNTIDLDISHQFQLAETLALRPLIGIKGATINQTIHSNWDAVIYTSTERVTNDFAGLGPTFGLAATWNIIDSLNLVGSFTAAYMWGNWKMNDVYNRPNALAGLITATTITTNMNNAKLGTMMFDYFVGLELLHPKKSNVSLTVGYEIQSWSNQLRMTAFQILPIRSDLTFQGVTCRLKIKL